METIRGVPRIPTDTVEFVNLAPEKWKCNKCGVIVVSLWRTIANQIADLHNKSYPQLRNSTSQTSSHSSSSSSSLNSCRHRFCALCLDKMFSGINNETRCPFDGVGLRKKQMTEDPLNTELLLQQEVYCTHKSRGCRKMLPLSELEGHIKSCLYGLVHCPLKCGQGITIKSLPMHMANLCPRRVIACQYCEEDIALDVKNDHEKACPKKPVNCLYCHQSSLVQSEMKTHLEKCPMKPRNCKLVPLGCKFSGTLTQVEEHESKWESHMDLVLKHILQNNHSFQDKAKNRLGDVVAIVKDLNNENELLKERTNDLTEKVESLQTGNKTLRDQVNRLESTHRAEMASMRTLVEVLRKEIEGLRAEISKLKDDDEDSEV